MLVGGGGADQITACAQYVPENGILTCRPASTRKASPTSRPTSPDADVRRPGAPPRCEQLQDRGITEFGLVVIDTPSFDEFVAAVQSEADEAGLTIGYETRINKTAAEPEQLSIVQALKDSGVQAVVLNTSPSCSSAWQQGSTRGTRRPGWGRASPAA